MKNYAYTVIPLFLSFVLSGSLPAAGDEVTNWNETAVKAGFDSGLSLPAGIPLFEARIYAMTHTAIHDALNTIEPSVSPVRAPRADNSRRLCRGCGCYGRAQGVG